MDQVDRKLLRALENGVPLVPEPFRQLGMSLEMSAAETIERIQRLKNEGVIRKLTARINHRNAGVVANAMVVWKVPEDQLSRIGVIMAGHPAVTHCYSRLTVPGVWDFNLYTVLHGFDREGVLALVETLSEMTEIRDYKVLFSTREFKRCSLPVPRRVQ